MCGKGFHGWWHNSCNVYEYLRVGIQPWEWSPNSLKKASRSSRVNQMLQHRRGILLIFVDLLLVTSTAQAVQIRAHADNVTGLNFTVLDNMGRGVMQSYPSALAFYINGRWFVDSLTISRG